MLEQLLVCAVHDVHRKGRPVRMLDIAAGHGRYVLEGVQKCGVAVESILLRDFAEANVIAGREAIARQGVTQARFEQADAFDASALSALTPRANVGIVSGLYELFPDNATVRESLRGLAAAIEPGGYLLYTGQPWHPQLEMIARTLKSHRGDGDAWVMRRRTQEELDGLVAAAGFRKVEQRIDPSGLFTVSRAERL